MNKRDTTILDKVRRLSKVQLQVLDLHLKNRSMTSTATGASMQITNKDSLGGVLSSLSRNHLIEPAGLEEGKSTYQWDLTPGVKEKKEEVTQLVDKILGLYK